MKMEILSENKNQKIFLKLKVKKLISENIFENFSPPHFNFLNFLRGKTAIGVFFSSKRLFKYLGVK